MANTGAKHADERRRECADHAIAGGEGIADAAGDPGGRPEGPAEAGPEARGQLDGGAPGREEPAEPRAARRRIRELGQEGGSLEKAGAFFAADQAWPEGAA